MHDFAASNLRRLMSQLNLTLAQVAAQTGLDQRTIKGILDGANRPHPTTLHRLAKGLGVSTDEFFVDPAQLLYRRLDRKTNPLVAEVVQTHRALFADWTEADFDELHSRVGTGGALTVEGTIAAAGQMNRNRKLHDKLALLLESGHAELVSGVLEAMYEKLVVPGEPERR